MYVIVRVSDSLFLAREEGRKYTPDIRQARTFLEYGNAHEFAIATCEVAKNVSAYLQTPEDMPF